MYRALGVKKPNKEVDDHTGWRKVDIAYPVAAAQKFRWIIPDPPRSHLRFVFISATGADRNTWKTFLDKTVNAEEKWTIKHWQIKVTRYPKSVNVLSQC